MSNINVRNCVIEYNIQGSGPAIVWGHGLASSMKQEDSFKVVDLAGLQNDYSILRYDARGHGASSFTKNLEDYSLENLARDQLELATSLGFKNYIATGISMGASTAITAAIISPERIKALILVLLPTAWEFRKAQAERYEKIAECIESGDMEGFQKLMKSVPLPDPLARFSSKKGKGPTVLEEDEKNRLSLIFRGLSKTDLPSVELINRISQPTLILGWTGDENHPLTTTARFQELVPHSKIVLATTFDGVKKWNEHIKSFVENI
ncbi:MAG: alpha/beta hydrolase [Spirochaetia bacterium]|jgi:pimeloyl-ACP methyl ester carboxylesterase|nr:alpha/beta hydrolase [Spirochaetia bacterium]